MFSLVAWLRLFVFASFLAPSFVRAHLNSIFTSSVSYCSPPESILIQQFDVAYIQRNASITFNVSAASVLPNLNVTANLFANVYGMRPLNQTIDLCSLLGGALCPLPTYNFTGADSITTPPGLDIDSIIPGIAYIIPDLEAFAQLTLTEVGTGKVRACIQSTLSNGWSTHQTGVEWATGAIALIALFSAVFYSWRNPNTLAAVRLLDVMSLFQAIAASGLLALDYPIVYRSYTLNYSWALGLFSSSMSSHIQHSINNMRRLTGGNVGSIGSDGSPISLVNRKLSPYNDNFAQLLLAQASSLPTMDISDFIAEHPQLPSLTKTASSALANADVLVGGDVATVTQESANVLEAGIPIYVNVIGIDTENAFMTVFFVALIFLAIVLTILGLGYLALYGWSRSSRGKDVSRDTLSQYPVFARAWGLRCALICALPVFIFTFYQWTLKDSWLSVLLSVILLIATLACILPPLFFVLRTIAILPIPARWREEEAELTDASAPLVASLRQERYYYLIPAMLAVLVKALVIAFGEHHGLVQAIVLLVLESFMLCIILVLRPHRTRGGDILSTFLAIIRVICTGLLIAFAESLNLGPIPRVVVGIVIAVIYSIAVVFMFFNVLWNLGLYRAFHCVRRWKGREDAPTGATTLGSHNASHSSLEKGQKGGSDKGDVSQASITPAPSSTWLHRPTNPSPTHTPTTISEFSPIPTTFSDAPTERTSTFMSSTLGDELPHRWSFQHSPPPSASAASRSASAPITPVTLSPTSPSTESAYTTPRHSWRPPSPDVQAISRSS